jgi:GNAT superfamily N-acetyltransferase
MTNVKIVPIHPKYGAQIRELQLICFPTVNPDELFFESEVVEMYESFPTGNFVAVDGEKVVGLGTGYYVNFDFEHPQHTMVELFSKGHSPDADWYYGTDISVHPDWRGHGIGSKLYDARKGVVRQDNKRGIIAGGFIPNFANHKHEMSVEEYVAKVVAKELYDPTLSFQIRNGFVVKGVIENYMTIGNSDNYATQIVWYNPDYKE